MKKSLLISICLMGLAACNSPVNLETTIGSCSDYAESLLPKTITKDKSTQDNSAGNLVWSYNADTKEFSLAHNGMCGACDDGSYYETKFELYEEADCYKLIEQQEVKSRSSTPACSNCRRNLELKANIEKDKICLTFVQVPLEQEDQQAWFGELDLTQKSGIIDFENKNPLLCMQ